MPLVLALLVGAGVTGRSLLRAPYLRGPHPSAGKAGAYVQAPCGRRGLARAEYWHRAVMAPYLWSWHILDWWRGIGRGWPAGRFYLLPTGGII